MIPTATFLPAGKVDAGVRDFSGRNHAAERESSAKTRCFIRVTTFFATSACR
jgi:hypothetical protein